MPAIIAEVKVRAPGRSNIDVLDLGTLVSAFERGGARAFSVLTDELHFGGSLENLRQVSRITRKPILHKEFIISPYQLLQGRLAGASGALLLSYYFTPSELQSMMQEAYAIGLEPVVECSLEEEIPGTIAANPRVLLLNNRPIAAIPENPDTTYQLGGIERARLFWERFPELREWKKQKDRILISASCISSAKDVAAIGELPYDAVLVGNAVASAEDPESFLRSLIK
jgi:indole-3-glycerol phosphate synthase